MSIKDELTEDEFNYIKALIIQNNFKINRIVKEGWMLNELLHPDEFGVIESLQDKFEVENPKVVRDFQDNKVMHRLPPQYLVKHNEKIIYTISTEEGRESALDLVSEKSGIPVEELEAELHPAFRQDKTQQCL